jgi:hypothetical protein
MDWPPRRVCATCKAAGIKRGFLVMACVHALTPSDGLAARSVELSAPPAINQPEIRELQARSGIVEPPVRAITTTNTTIAPPTGALTLEGYAPVTR